MRILERIGTPIDWLCQKIVTSRIWRTIFTDEGAFICLVAIMIFALIMIASIDSNPASIK